MANPGAGEIVVEDGVVTLVSNFSGHYRPTPDMHDRVIDQLTRQGMDLSMIEHRVWQ